VLEYLKLTKPTIMVLVLFTGAIALVVEGSMLLQPERFLLFMVALYLTGGCANALNQFFERDIDARMSRTSSRRPLPQQKLTPGQALTFAVIIGIVGLILMVFFFNWLTALLSLTTILFYGFLYTLFLKPGTSQNIVIGGAAGAMAPVGAWAAATGTMAWTPWAMFAIIFLWTPPHFWALAIAFKDDYVKAGLPMMPVVRGVKSTHTQIFVYSILLTVASLTPMLFGAGLLYMGVALILGAMLIRKVVHAGVEMNESGFKALFWFSIWYLFGLFGALGLDVLIRISL